MMNGKTGQNEEGWAEVSMKKNKPNGNRTPKYPYIDVVSSTSKRGDVGNSQPFMVLLVGLPGSGKSTFAQSLVQSMPNKFSRINQDELKTRKKCEKKLKRVLGFPSSSASQQAQQQRFCPIIDRCNFDQSQRSKWYQLAKEAPRQSSMGVPVDVVVLDVPFDECLKRCESRKGHEMIKSPKQAREVMQQFRRQWSPPHLQRNKNEENMYRSLTVVRTNQERKQCLVQLLNQTH